jgi:hypothetical protein
MTQSEPSAGESSTGRSSKALARRVGAYNGEGVRARIEVGWVKQHRVLAAGLVFIAVALIWRAQILSHLYFRQDDFENLDLAFKSSLNMHYLTFVGSGDFMMGHRLLDWLVSRTALYNWTLATTIILVLFATAALAALRVLRTLFGEHPAILIALAVYLLSPLTLPSFGWWSSAAEELPVQLAIFMAMNAHVQYIRTRRNSHLAAAVGSVAFGLFFYEKALVLPLLLFTVTAAYFAGRRTFLGGAWLALTRYRTAWLSYAALLIAYAILLAVSLRTAIAQPQMPHSLGAVTTFSWHLLKDELIPGSMGGPWRWLPISGHSYAIAATPVGLGWLAMIIAIAVVGVSVVRRKVAWRAWAIWIGWVAVADMVPVVIRRINDLSPVLYALETRYVADSVAVLIICLCLAFLPLVPEHRATVPGISWVWHSEGDDLAWRRFASGVIVFFAIGSLLSVWSYESHVSGKSAASYLANARSALRLAPRAAVIVDAPVPADIVVGPVHPALASTVLGDMVSKRARWITAPVGTIDGLRMFGPDGRLYLAGVKGGASPWGHPCFAKHHGRIVVNFWTASPGYSNVLRIGYLWYSKVQGTAVVHYGASRYVMPLEPGLHAGYLKVSSSAHGIVVTHIVGGGLCVGAASAGFLTPDYKAPALPPARATVGAFKS